MRLLIIEDSDTIRPMLDNPLCAGGHEVEAVPTGPKGVDGALEHPPDAILLDLHLRGPYDGFEVCAKLRASPATRDDPHHRHQRAEPTTRRNSARSRRARLPTTRSPSARAALLKEIESIGARESTRLRVE